MADGIQLNIRVNSETGQIDVLGAKLEGLGKSATKAQGSFSGLTGEATGLLKSFLPFATAGGILAFFTNAIKGAEEENESLRRLSSTVKTNGGDWEANKQKVLDWTQAIQQVTRFSDGQALQSLDKLTRTTGSLGQGMSATKLSMDLAVKSGHTLEETTQIVTALILGQTRALLEARREFGSLAGDASTAQGVLDALGKSSAGAAEQEDDLTKKTHLASNAWKELSDKIGTAFAPAAAGVLTVMKNLVVVIELFGTAVAGSVKLSIDAFTGFFNVLKAGVLHPTELKQAVKQAMDDIKNDVAVAGDDMAETLTNSQQRTVAAFEQSGNERLRIHHTKTEEELKAEQEHQEKVVELLDQMNVKTAQLSDEGLAKKKAVMDAEYKAEVDNAKKIQKTEAEAVAFGSKLQEFRKAQELDLARETLRIRQQLGYDILTTAVQTFQALNSLDESGSESARLRAKALLAVQQAIAIGWVWVSAAKQAAETGQPELVSTLAAAQTGLLVAQFAQGVRSIDQAGAREAQGIQGISIAPSAPGLDLGTTSPSSGGSVGSSGGGGGSGGGGTIINVGGVVINFDVTKLSIDNIDVVMRSMYERARQGTIEGVQLALQLNAIAAKNASLAS